MEDPLGIIFDIKRYAIHDGEGIRTTVFFKGCPIRCQWCANPESQNASPELVYLKNDCIHCGRCADVCHQEAIHLSSDGPEFWTHQINRPSCDFCEKCVKTCPAEALQIMGRMISVKDLYAEVTSDRPFWERSGGGVTLSGGDPFLQHAFIKRLLKKCKDNYVHTAIETSLHVHTNILNDIYPLVNTIICDLKMMDEKKHRQFTGVSNKLILKNIAYLLRDEMDQAVLVRMPLIPGINDDLENLKQLGHFLTSHNPEVRLELLPYHRLGEFKYERLGRTYPLSDILPPSRDAMEKAYAVLKKYKINLSITGC